MKARKEPKELMKARKEPKELMKELEGTDQVNELKRELKKFKFKFISVFL